MLVTRSPSARSIGAGVPGVVALQWHRSVPQCLLAGPANGVALAAIRRVWLAAVDGNDPRRDDRPQMDRPPRSTVEDVLGKLEALHSRDEQPSADDILEPLREVWRSQRDGQKLPARLASVAFRLVASADVAPPERAALYSALRDLWREDPDYRRLAQSRLDQIKQIDQRAARRRGDAGRSARTQSDLTDYEAQWLRDQRVWQETEQRDREALDTFAKSLLAMTDMDELWAVAAAQRQHRQRHLLVLDRLLSLGRSPSVLVALGAAYRTAGELDKAHELLAEALAHDPDSRQGRTAMMALLRARGGPALGEAQRIGERLLAEDPRDAYALNALGGVAADFGDLARAEDLFRRAAARAPRDRTARTRLLHLGRRYRDEGDLVGAARIERILRDLGVSDM